MNNYTPGNTVMTTQSNEAKSPEVVRLLRNFPGKQDTKYNTEKQTKKGNKEVFCTEGFSDKTPSLNHGEEAKASKEVKNWRRQIAWKKSEQKRE